MSVSGSCSTVSQLQSLNPHPHPQSPFPVRFQGSCVCASVGQVRIKPSGKQRYAVTRLPVTSLPVTINHKPSWHMHMCDTSHVKPLTLMSFRPANLSQLQFAG